MVAELSQMYIASPHRLTPVQWQRAIDDMDLVVRVVLDEGDVARMSGSIRATLDGDEVVWFPWAESPLLSAVRDAGFSHLFATPAEGPVKPVLISRIAALAYLRASKGACYVPNEGMQYPPEDDEPSKLWRDNDINLAIFCGKLNECRVRYPEDFVPDENAGPMIASVRRIN